MKITRHFTTERFKTVWAFILPDKLYNYFKFSPQIALEL